MRPWPLGDLLRPPIPKKLPVVLAPKEVWRIVEQVRRSDYRVCVSVIAACGLRLLEGVRLQVSQIDSTCMQSPVIALQRLADNALPRLILFACAHFISPSVNSARIIARLAI